MNFTLLLILGALGFGPLILNAFLLSVFRRTPGPRNWASHFASDAGSVDTFIPEVWSKKLLSSLKKTHVYGNALNHDYEGEISQAGDTVHINSVGRPTISTYVPNSTVITPETLTTAQRALIIDQPKYFAFEIDDVDKRQAQDGLMEEALDEASYGLRDVVDIYVEAMLRAGAASSNALGAVSVPNATDVYNKLLVQLSVKLDEANVPSDGRFVVVPPWVHGNLLLDDRFIRADATGTAPASVSGKVGRAAGFDVWVSNNAPVVTGDDSSVIAAHRMAGTFAEQINKVEAYRPESSFSDAVKGLHLWGAKVVRPEAIATALASKT